MLSRERITRPRAGVFAAVAVTIGLTTALGVPLATAQAARADGGPQPGGVLGSGQIATHYAPTPQGNCSYPTEPSDNLYAALPPSEYGNGAACGEYLQVNGPLGHQVQVEVTDQCPQCAPGHVDLSQDAFSRLSPLPVGIMPVSYHVITDPQLPAPLSVRVKEGSSAGWLALLPMNTGNALTSVQVKNSSGGWDSLTRSGYGYWLAPGGEGPGPFTVQLTDTAGHTVTLDNITLSPGQVQSTQTWMYQNPAPGSAPGSQGQTPLLPGVLHPAAGH